MKSKTTRRAAPGADSAEAAVQAHADAAQAFGANVGEMLKSLTSMRLPIEAIGHMQTEYLKGATELWNQTLAATGLSPKEAPSGKPAAIADRRFASSEWTTNPAAAYVAQMYLLNARTMLQMAEELQADERTKSRVRFAVQQWIDASSPANFLALNPEAQKKALETGGESIALGLRHLVEDLRKGHVSQTDEAQFEVGRNMAVTEGTVVFENHLFQLIEYKPLTPTVHEKPFLLVPPCINKYYILDLQPENSFLRYAVSQGHRVFCMSWANPDDSMAQLTWDDYIEDAVIKAITVTQEISGAAGKDASVNMLGFCVGGTILATALAVLAARGQQPASSLTMLTSFLDFSHTGVLQIFVDEASTQLREMTIGAQSPNGGGLLKGRELAQTFSFLRPNDLVWNYVVGNYLKGETPPPFDLLYWNGDSTNLPGPMYCWYLRNTYLEDNLKVPGKVTTCGEKVDLGSIKAPVYIYASREDHIVPWEGAYATTRILKGKKRFMLGASGHIAGVINPPAKGKRSHWVYNGATLPATAQAWFEKAEEKPGSWWPDWAAWLASHAGKMVAAPKSPGNRTHKAIEPAPGRYVKKKA
jgi:polyhydroxyalkanoate synthase